MVVVERLAAIKFANNDVNGRTSSTTCFLAFARANCGGDGGASNKVRSLGTEAWGLRTS